MLARLFVIVGGLLVVALCALLLAPFFVNWAGYRSAFEREASRIIGQPVRVEGTAKARILPFPSVTFSSVVIDGADGIPAARIAAFSMDAELAPFLSGEILIFDMRIERPDVRLKLAESGALLWALPQSDVLSGNTISLENVNISDGRVTVERAGQAAMLITGLNGKVSAQSLSGPWLAEGQFIHGTTTYDARASTGAKITGETLRARLSLVPQGGFYEAAFDGQIGLENGAPNYAGKMNTAVLGTVLDAKSKRQKIADIKGDFSVNSDAIRITKAELTAGPKDKPYRADGSAGLLFGDDARFDVVLKGQQIGIGDVQATSKADRANLGMPLADRFAAIESVLSQIPVPDMPGKVDLLLPALVIGDTVIRNAEVKAAPAKTGWKIERYSLELPGRTIIEGAGNLALGGEFGFIGQMTLASKQPTGLASWLGLKANDVIRALPGAGFDARIDVSATRQTFRDIELRAGAVVLRGLISRQVLSGANSRTSVQLAGENADLDIASGAAELASLQSSGFGVGFATEDIDIVFGSAPVSGFGFQAEKLDTKLRLSNGALTIEDLNITNLAGADIHAAGTVLGADKAYSELDVTVSAIDAMPFIDALAARFPDRSWLNEASKRAGFVRTALADTKLEALFKWSGLDTSSATFAADMDYGFDAAGLRFSGTGVSRDQKLTINANGNSDIGETLLAGLGIPVGDSLTALQLLEPVAFDVSLETKAGEIQTGSLKATSNQDIFETSFGSGAQPFSLTLADAAPYAMAAGYGLPGSAFGLPLQLNGMWGKTGSTKTGATLDLQKLEGTLIDVLVSGDLSLILSERLKLTGNIKAQSLDRSAIDEIVLGPLSASGDDKAEFAGNISLPFNADIALAVDEATGFLPLTVSQASARIVATKDALRFYDITGEIAGGKLAGAGELRKNGPEAQFNVNGSMSAADLATIYRGAIEGKTDLQIELSATGTTVESFASSLTGSGVISAKNMTLSGVTTAEFKSLVEEADSLEAAPDEVATLEIATRKIMTGQTIFSPFQMAFAVTSSVARAPRSQLKIDGGVFSIEPKMDLNSGVADITAQLQFDAGEDELAGAEPAINFNLKGPWNTLSLALDAQPLQGFLGQRALEREEIRVEAIQSALLEKQRLRRENRYYAWLIEARATAEAERLAEIDRAAKEAAKAEQERLDNERLDQERWEKERLEKERLDQERLEKERLKAEKAKALTDGEQVAPNQAQVPAGAQVEQLLNLDGLLKELDAKPNIQP